MTRPDSAGLTEHRADAGRPHRADAGLSPRARTGRAACRQRASCRWRQGMQWRVNGLIFSRSNGIDASQSTHRP